MNNRPSVTLWFQDVLDHLAENDPITGLNQSSRGMDDTTLTLLASALGRNTHVERLVLSINAIGPVGIKALAVTLRKRNCSIVVLELWENQIGDMGAKVMGGVLKVNKRLVSLHLAKNAIGYQGARALAQGLKYNKVLQKLWLGRNYVGNKGAIAFGEMLKVNQHLLFLNLFGNCIGPEGAQGLAEGLRYNNTLQCLHLGYNQIGNDGACAFGIMLQFNECIKVLHLWGNDIGDVGLVALATNGLMWNSSLEELGFHGVALGINGARALQKALQANTTLKTLLLSGQSNSDHEESGDIVRHIAGGLENNSCLTKLRLVENSSDATRQDDSGAIAASQMLRVNKTLLCLQLQLTNCNTGNEGVVAIMEALQENHTLAQLTVHGNKINDGCTAAIETMLQSNRTLKELTLNGTRIQDWNPVLNGLRVNFDLVHLSMDNRNNRPENALLDFYLRLNRAGRRLLREDNVPTSLWAQVFSRMKHDCDVVYYFCCAKPDLFQHAGKKEQTPKM